MDVASLAQIKKELKHLDKEELANLCIQLAKYKKNNKEFLHYLIFEAHAEEDYIASVKEEMVNAFEMLNSYSIYTTKKGVQKILRNLKKYIRYSNKKETEVALLLFFCEQVLEYRIPIRRSSVLYNLYERQVNLINKALDKLHEDFRFDYEEALENVSKVLRDYT